MSSSLVPQPSERQLRQAAELGHVTRLLFESSRALYRIASIRAWVWPAIRLGQIEIDFDRKGTPTGFATWAFLKEDVAAQLVDDPSRLLHLTEWNEGDQLWVIDVVAPRGFNRYFRERLRRRFSGAPSVFGIRRDDHGAVRRVVELRPRDLGQTG